MKMHSSSSCAGAARHEQAPVRGNDVSHLAHVLANANASPERFEEIIRNALVANSELHSAEGQVQQFEAFALSLQKDLDALRRDQDAVLPGIGHAMSLFRSEARLFQIGFLVGTRRTLALLAAIALLQVANLILSIWMMNNIN